MCNKRYSPAGRRYTMRKSLLVNAEICVRKYVCGIPSMFCGSVVCVGIFVGIPVVAAVLFGII